MNPASHAPPLDHTEVIGRFVEVCVSDERMLAAMLTGSHARGEADGYSDLDLCLVTTDEAHAGVRSEARAIIDRLGEPLFLERFGNEDLTFWILSDGTEGELLIAREGVLPDLALGPFRILVDKRGLLEHARFPIRGPDRADQLRALDQALHWFWHELSHFTAAVGRDQLWWAAGQLEALRRHCVTLVRLEQGARADEEPYEKLDAAISTAALAALRATFVPIERTAMLRAGREILAFYRELAPAVARAYGSTYPAELDRLMAARLEDASAR